MLIKKFNLNFYMGKRIHTKKTCLNCGKEFEFIDRTPDAVKIVLFCSDCLKILTPFQRKKLRIQKLEGYEEKYHKQKRESWLKNYKQAMLNKAKKRAKKYNLDFDITKEDIIIPEICPILEVPLVIGTKGDYEYSPSLDRIDNSKGYTKDNIQVISKKANSMKNSASIEELKLFCKNILRYSLNNRENEFIEQEDKEPLG